MQKIIALRSLISPHHAENIAPKILNVTWNLGKRCNYDCSYCSPDVHDWASDHMSVDTIKDFLVKADSWAIANQKTIKWNYTGGEPYLHPNILEILEITRNSKSCDELLTVITNGSMPLELYQESFKNVTNLTVSLHFDRSDKEVEKTVEKIIELNQNNPDKFITVQVMMFPGKFDFINLMVEKFVKNSVKHVYRRIRPYTDEIYTSVYGDADKRKLLKTKSTDDSTSVNILKKYYFNNLLKIYKNEEYYTRDELAWLEENAPEGRWQNIGVWYEDNTYIEMNSDELVSNNLHQFKGWACYIGVDCAFINHTGDIFRGSCGNDGAIGTIKDFKGFSAGPTVCKNELCMSNPDLTTRKASPDYEYLIS